MTDSMYPKPSRALAEKRAALAPEAEAAFRQFSEAVFRDGALPRKTFSMGEAREKRFYMEARKIS